MAALNPISSKVQAKQAANLVCRFVSSTSSNQATRAEGRRPGSANIDKGSTIAAMKKGTGYRSSFSGKVATIFGVTTGIGRGVANALGQEGAQMVIAYRGDPYDVRHIKTCGDLGQVLFTPFHLRDEESIRKSMKYSNVVVNMIGNEASTKNFSLRDVFVTGPALMAKCAREAGVERFIHFSHINARENPSTAFLPKSWNSEYLKTKWEGEQRVLEEFPDATIIRPSDMYGMQDKFLSYWFSFWRYAGTFGRKMALYGKGDYTVKAPVYFGDVARAVVASMEAPNAKGAIFELYGPEFYKLGDLIDWMNLTAGRTPVDFHYKRGELLLSPSTFGKTIAIELLPLGWKYMNRLTLSRLDQMSKSDLVEGHLDFSDLGMTPHTIFDKMPYEILPYHFNAHFHYDNPADKPKVERIKPVSRPEMKQIIADELTDPMEKWNIGKQKPSWGLGQ